MKIVQVLNHFLPHKIAGTEVYTYALCKYLQHENVISKVAIPNYGELFSDIYFYDGVSVFQYSEPSIVDRDLVMGFRTPEGLNSFGRYLEIEDPDIVHFHELAGSNGITLEHVKLAKSLGFKVMMTFHLAGYSCKTGTLVQNGNKLCSGVISELTCGICYLSHRKLRLMSFPIAKISQLSKRNGLDFRNLNNPIGTLFGTANIIGKLKLDLLELSNLCDQVVCLTNWYRDILLKNGIDAGKITLIEQGLPFANIVNSDSSVVIEKTRPIKLIFIGRISKFKGVHLLLDALAFFSKELVELSIYGNAEQNDYVDNLRNKSVKMLNVKWMGELKQPDVISTIAQHDFLCLCSTFSEMSPLVIQEAKAANIPVLASDVYGNAEQIIHDFNGLLFEFNNLNSLKNQIYRILHEPGLILKLKMNITKPRSFKLVGDEYLVLYNKLINGS